MNRAFIPQLSFLLRSIFWVCVLKKWQVEHINKKIKNQKHCRRKEKSNNKTKTEQKQIILNKYYKQYIVLQKRDDLHTMKTSIINLIQTGPAFSKLPLEPYLWGWNLSYQLIYGKSKVTIFLNLNVLARGGRLDLVQKGKLIHSFSSSLLMNSTTLA